MTFAFLSYSGIEPEWATALRESDFPGLQVYSPGLPLEGQLEALGDELAARKPNAVAYTYPRTLRIEESIWMPFTEALPTLMEADSCTLTSQMVWRDVYLLVRADALIVDARGTNELALLASLLGIPVIAISYRPTGLHPWLSHCAQVTVNSPNSIGQIVDVLDSIFNSKRNSPPIPEPENIEDHDHAGEGCGCQFPKKEESP